MSKSGDPWCGWLAHHTATNEPHFEGLYSNPTSSEEYIATEFQNLCEGTTEGQCISISSTFRRGKENEENEIDKNEGKLGEEAEKKVFDRFQGCKIPGLKLLQFHGQRYMGQKNATCQVVREKDFTVFAELKGHFFILLMEVKCLEKPNNQHRKKARSQLCGHCEVLKVTHKLPDDEVDKILLHSAWPRLSKEYQCSFESCVSPHGTYQGVPETCPDFQKLQKPQYEPSGWHVFKEAFESQKKFNKWLEHILVAEKAIDQTTWTKILRIHTLHSRGVLYDEISKKFKILGKDQNNLLHLPKHKLSHPRFISGTAGTGKTLTVCAKIEELVNNNEVDEDNKVLYICFSDGMISWVKNELKRLESKVNLELCTLVNYKSSDIFKNFYKESKKMAELLYQEKYRYIFIDEAQDLGVKEIESMIRSVTNKDDYFELEQPYGHFWILFDVFQSESDDHQLSMIGEKRSRIRWDGSVINEKVFKKGKEKGLIITLTEIFRMTDRIVEHIKLNGINPKLRHLSTCGIKGPKVNVTEIEINDNQVSAFVERTFIEQMKDMFNRNIHMGDIFILLDKSDCDLLQCFFELDNLRSSMNSKLKEEISLKDTSRLPQVDSEITHIVEFSHSTSLLKCTCKAFLGFVEDVKGLTSKVVIYAAFHRRHDDALFPIQGEPNTVSRTSPYYKSISRSSCEVQVLNFVLPDQVLDSVGIKDDNLPPIKDPKLRVSIENHNKGIGIEPPLVRRQ